MKKKILVADKSVTIQKIVAMAFEHEDTVVEGVSKGKDALDRMQTLKPDILLADIDMQDLTGFELSKKVKNDPKFSPTKILLLASDFEDFNKNLFDSSGADDLISKPFKSEDIIKKVDDLLSEKSPDSNDETINLTPVDLDVSAESTETTIELSLGDLAEKEDSTINLSSAELEESINPTPIEEKEHKKTEEGTLDIMIHDVESLKKLIEPSDACYDELSEEVAPTQEDTVGDELDMAFREIVNFGSPKKSDNTSRIQLKPISNPSTLDDITPEPEDLLKEITSSAEKGGERLTTTNLIANNSSRPPQVSLGIKNKQSTTQNKQTMADPVRNILEEVIHASIEKELAELSNSITKSVRAIVQEITPKIVRDIVKEEIDKIKNS
jgi:DNA-binding response OmpR family regulator